MSNILNWIRNLFNKDKQSINEIQKIKNGSSYVQFAAIEGLTLEGIGKIFKGNKNAIRGREQQLIEANGGAKSEAGTLGNAINGIGPNNKKKDIYIKAAQEEFK